MDRKSRRERLYPAAHESLMQWGAMFRENPFGIEGGLTSYPEMVELVGENKDWHYLKIEYDFDTAEIIDRLLPAVMKVEECEIAVLSYAVAFPPKLAVDRLNEFHALTWEGKPLQATVWDEPRRPRWDVTEFKARRDEMVGRVDMALKVAGK